jgi:translation elongation factor EF-Tu-like GTPase
MNQAIFVPQSLFKIAGKGLLVAGSLKSGVLKQEMFTEIKKQKINLIGIEAFNKTVEEVKETDPAAKSLGIILPGSAEKIFADSMNQEIIFREPK